LPSIERLACALRPARLHTPALGGLAVAVLLSACSTTPPTPEPPPAVRALEIALRTAPAPARAAPEEDLDAATWAGFDDPLLNALLPEVRRAHLNVRIAAQRVRQARAGLEATASRLWPTVALTGSVSTQRSGLPEEVKRGQPDTRALRGALDLSWELDLSGAAQAAADAAALDALSAESGEQVARWLATTELARQVLVWQGARVRLQQLDALLQALRDTERLTRSRQAEGLASALDVSRVAAEVQALAAQRPALVTLRAVTEHHIDTLRGVAPGQADWATWNAQPPRVPVPPRLAPGQPVELLQRRPDLQAAERQWRAESARGREARADRWPRFFIAAVLGRQDLKLNALSLSPVGYGSAALALAAPLFNAGRLEAAVERQSGREEAARLNYERVVIGALQDVENSLVALTQEREREQALAAAVASRRVTLQHAESLWREGQIDRLQRLEAQRGLLAAELSHTDSLVQRALGAVQLVKALGGGWYAEPPGSAAMSTAEIRGVRP
jgi:NodT family efflux transporter outer membrane factor (OMF) lipoprotein